MRNLSKNTIGRVEEVRLPLFGNETLYARIDTGAKTSSVWATAVVKGEEGLEVTLESLGNASDKHTQVFKDYDRTNVSTSTGQVQQRYRVKMPIVICGRRINTTFTIADRSSQVYPVLVGRNTLQGKFIVDVKKGSPLFKKEKARSEELQKNMKGEVI